MSERKSLTWDIAISPWELLKTSVKVLALAVVLTWTIIEIACLFSGMSFTKAIFKAISSNDPYFYYAAGFIGFWLLLSFLVCWALFRNGYPVSYLIDSDGVKQATQPQQRKINHRINMLLFWLSLFSRRPGGMGTAILAETGQSAAYDWQEISKIELHPDRRVIDLKNSWRTLITLYCHEDNYHAAVDLVEFYCHEAEPKRATAKAAAPSFGSQISSLLVYPGIAIAGLCVWQSPLLVSKGAVIALVVLAFMARLTIGQWKRYTSCLVLACIVGLLLGMLLNAFEVTTNTLLFRIYRYQRLDRPDEAAAFIISLIGLAGFSLLACRSLARSKKTV